MRTYVYVDGESHFLRSRKCWKDMHGQDAELEQVNYNSSMSLFGGFDGCPPVACDFKTKFFFDFTGNPYPGLFNYAPARIHRAVYFTSVTGDSDELHRARVFIRKHQFEPHIIRENRNLADNRENVLEHSGVIEKAKGVDIALAVRMMEDAYLNNYDTCFLFTSDVDYLPVIEVVRRMGKIVCVFGYKSGLGTDSSFEFVPDKFLDLKVRPMSLYICKEKSKT